MVDGSTIVLNDSIHVPGFKTLFTLFAVYTIIYLLLLFPEHLKHPVGDGESAGYVEGAEEHGQDAQGQLQ